MSPPRSSHVSEPFFEPFLESNYDPAAYFNSTLPNLLPASTSNVPRSSSMPLPELSSQTQNLLSQLNAQTSRLTGLLTQLTDDILRTGGRLAYQVEVLRGETLGLSETLNEGLQSDIAKFAPLSGTCGSAQTLDGVGSSNMEDDANTVNKAPVGEASVTPSHLEQLRMLTQVRDRLESVIKVFGEAMQWTVPPSEVSLTSSLISVSAPEQPGADSQSREEKGREYAAKLRREITELITGTNQQREGHEAALERIQALRDLAQVWKGTSEEKARVKFVESLAKLADEKQKVVQRDLEAQRQREIRSSPRKPTQSTRQAGQDKPFSILDRLYLD